MTIQLNGEERSFDGPLSAAALLEEIGLNGHPVILELNGLALHRGELETARVEEGARIEIVRIAAGG